MYKQLCIVLRWGQVQTNQHGVKGAQMNANIQRSKKLYLVFRWAYVKSYLHGVKSKAGASNSSMC